MEQARTISRHERIDTISSGAGQPPPNGPFKLERVLAHLATGKSLNRFEAERIVNDHCLHSTMSEIKHELGIFYCRKFETVPGWNGHSTRVVRYWLDDHSQRKARKVVLAMRKRRGAL